MKYAIVHCYGDPIYNEPYEDEVKRFDTKEQADAELVKYGETKFGFYAVKEIKDN